MLERLGEIARNFGNRYGSEVRPPGALALDDQCQRDVDDAFRGSHVADQHTRQRRRRDHSGTRLIGQIVAGPVVIGRRFSNERHAA
jgi:hypothetical protein